MRIPGTSAHFSRLFETLSSPRATLSKQTMQNIVMTTHQEYTMSHYSFLTTMNKKSSTRLCGDQFSFDLKRLIGIKITLVKYTYPKGETERGTLCSIILCWLSLTSDGSVYFMHLVLKEYVLLQKFQLL